MFHPSTARALPGALLGMAIWAVLGGPVGQAYAQCRPAAGDPVFAHRAPAVCAEPSVPALRFGGQLLVGVWDREAPVSHFAGGFAIPFDLHLTQAFALGVRGGFVAGGDAARDADGDFLEDEDRADDWVLTLLGGPRFVLHTEPARREAWRLEASAGWLESMRGQGGDGPVLELAIERQAGMLVVDDRREKAGTGHALILGVRAQQGLGDAASHRALLVSAGYVLEPFARTPDGARPRQVPPDVEHVFAVDAGLGGGFRGAGLVEAVGLQLGLPFGRLLGLRLRGDLLHFEGGEVDGGERDGAPVVAALAGLRVSRWSLFWLEVLGGWSHAFTTEPTGPAGGASLDVGAGLQSPNLFGCGVGAHLGQRLRWTFRDDDRGVIALYVTLGVSYDSLIRARECWP